MCRMNGKNWTSVGKRDRISENDLSAETDDPKGGGSGSCACRGDKADGAGNPGDRDLGDAVTGQAG